MDLVTTIADYLLDYAPRDYHSEEARKALEEANSFMLTLFKLVEDCDREQYNTLVDLIGEYLYADQDKSTKTLEKMWG